MACAWNGADGADGAQLVSAVARYRVHGALTGFCLYNTLVRWRAWATYLTAGQLAELEGHMAELADLAEDSVISESNVVLDIEGCSSCPRRSTTTRREKLGRG